MGEKGSKLGGAIGLSFFAFVFAFIWASLSPALAVELQTTETYAAPIYSLTVTAKRLIGFDNMTVLNLEELEALGAVTVADALRMTPDIVILQYGRRGTPQRVGIRGTGAPEALILVDGSPMPAGNNAAPLEIPLADIDRIEIVKGQPNSLFIGGAINIVTKAASANTAAYVASSDPFPEWDMLVTESDMIGETEFLLTAYHTTLPFSPPSDADRQRYVRVRLDRDLAEGSRASANLAWSLSEHGTTQGSRLAWDSPASETINYDGVVVANLSYKGQIPQGQIEAKSFAHLIHEEVDALGHQTGTNDAVVGAEVRASLHLGPGEVVVGAGARRESARGGELNGHEVTFDFAKLFAKLSRPLGTSAQVSVGAQADLYSAFEPIVSPSVGISVEALPQTVVRASAAHAFRPPALSDWRMLGTSKADLRPEKGWRYELGLSHTLGAGFVGIDLFREQLVDRIHRRPDASGVPRPENVSETVTQGIDLTLGAPLGEALSTSLRWRWVDDRNGDGEKLPFVPSHEMHLGLRFLGSTTFGNVELQLLGPRPNGVGVTLPTLAVANGRIVHATGRNIDLFAEGYNLFDARDVDGAPNTVPGRTLMFGASLNF